MNAWLISNWLWWWPTIETAIDDARPGDATQLAAVHAASFASDWSEEEIGAFLRDPNVFCLVARRANVFGTKSPIGFVLVRMAADEAEILTVAVAPPHRGRGLGRQLVETALRRLYGERIAACFLEVDGGNVAALALYRRLGFATVGKRKGYYRAGSKPGADALVMRADLR